MSTELPLDRASSYRADIDGLRAIAVVSVVLFHAKLSLFGGGFVGVDVFFVISGYLITGLLMTERRRGGISIAGFYHRRILRIFPALGAVALACLLCAALVFPPQDFADFGRSLVATALFSSNVYFDATQAAAGYFDTSSQTQLLLHTWSLSVEEQFYIAMPLGLVLMRARSQGFVLRVLAGATALSFALSLWMVSAHRTEAFYVVVPRAWELLVGALVAVAGRPAPASRTVREAMAGLGVTMILWAILAYSAATPFPGMAALVPCLGAALVIQAGVGGTRAGGTSLVGRLLGSRAMVAIGLVSYSLYLWHWPALVVTRQLCAGSTAPGPTIVALAGALVMSIVSYRFVERPFRRGGRGRSRRAVLAGGAAACGLAALAGLAIVAIGGAPGRFDRKTLDTVAANAARHSDHLADVCGNWHHDMPSRTDFDICGFGNEHRKLLVWGDSMAEELQPLLRRLHDERRLADHGVLFALSLGCPPALGLERPGSSCARTNAWSLERAEAADVDAVLVVFAPWWERYERRLCRLENGTCAGWLSGPAAETLVVEDLRASLTKLRGLGKHVVLGLPLPDYSLDTTRLATQEAIAPGLTGALRGLGLVRLERYDYRSLRQKLVDLANELGIGLFDPRDDLCHGEACTYAEDGVSVYVEGQHIALSRTGLFHDRLAAALADAFAAAPDGDLRADRAAP